MVQPLCMDSIAQTRNIFELVQANAFTQILKPDERQILNNPPPWILLRNRELHFSCARQYAHPNFETRLIIINVQSRGMGSAVNRENMFELVQATMLAQMLNPMDIWRCARGVYATSDGVQCCLLGR